MSKNVLINWLSFWKLCGIIFSGSLLMLLFGNETKLICAKESSPPSQCSLQYYGVFGLDRETVIPLDEIKKVDLQAKSEEEGEDEAQLVLVTKTQPISIGDYGSYEDKDRIASQLGWFLETPTATYFNWSEGNRLFSWGIFATMLGMTIAYISKKVEPNQTKGRRGEG